MEFREFNYEDDLMFWFHRIKEKMTCMEYCVEEYILDEKKFLKEFAEELKGVAEGKRNAFSVWEGDKKIGFICFRHESQLAHCDLIYEYTDYHYEEFAKLMCEKAREYGWNYIEHFFPTYELWEKLQNQWDKGERIKADFFKQTTDLKAAREGMEKAGFKFRRNIFPKYLDLMRKEL